MPLASVMVLSQIANNFVDQTHYFFMSETYFLLRSHFSNISFLLLVATLPTAPSPYSTIESLE